MAKNYKTSFQQLNELKIIEKNKKDGMFGYGLCASCALSNYCGLNKSDYDIESFRKIHRAISKAEILMLEYSWF